MKKFYCLFLALSLLTVNAQDFGPDGNIVNNSSLQTGEVLFIGHDPLFGTGTNSVYDANVIDTQNYLNERLLDFTYGRNFFRFVVTNDSPDGCFCKNAVSNQVDFIIKTICPPEYIDYAISTWGNLHVLSHCIGKFGEANSLNCSSGNCLKTNYGNPYDIMGRGNRDWNAYFKEAIGAIGINGLRSLTYVTNTGTYYITDLESQSGGSKALKILVSDSYNLYNGPFNDRRNFYYVEMRNNLLTGPISNGKGKKKVTTLSHGPGVMVNMGQHDYTFQGNRYSYNSALLRTDFGYNGVMKAGNYFQDTQVSTVVDYWSGTAVTNLVKKVPFSVQVISVDNLGASVRVTFN